METKAPWKIPDSIIIIIIITDARPAFKCPKLPLSLKESSVSPARSLALTCAFDGEAKFCDKHY